MSDYPVYDFHEPYTMLTTEYHRIALETGQTDRLRDFRRQQRLNTLLYYFLSFVSLIVMGLIIRGGVDLFALGVGLPTAALFAGCSAFFIDLIRQKQNPIRNDGLNLTACLTIVPMLWTGANMVLYLFLQYPIAAGTSLPAVQIALTLIIGNALILIDGSIFATLFFLMEPLMSWRSTLLYSVSYVLDHIQFWLEHEPKQKWVNKKRKYAETEEIQEEPESNQADADEHRENASSKAQ